MTTRARNRIRLESVDGRKSTDSGRLLFGDRKNRTAHSQHGHTVGHERSVILRTVQKYVLELLRQLVLRSSLDSGGKPCHRIYGLADCRLQAYRHRGKPSSEGRKVCPGSSRCKKRWRLPCSFISLPLFMNPSAHMKSFRSERCHIQNCRPPL